MIKKISIETISSDFLDELIEVEFGSHFDIKNPTHRKELEYRIHKMKCLNWRFFGLFEKSEPIGYASVEFVVNLHSENIVEVMQIAVKKDFRGKNYGSSLLNHIERICLKDGIYKILVRTYAADYQVIHFYGQNQYVPIAVIPETNGSTDEGTIVMRKTLKRI